VRQLFNGGRHPDLWLLLGDNAYTAGKDDEYQAGIFMAYIDTLRSVPLWPSLGNHDGGRWSGENGGYSDIKWITEVLSESRIQLLHNTATQLRVRDWPLQFVGVGDTWAASLDANAAFRAADAQVPTILLSHNPDAKEEVGDGCQAEACARAFLPLIEDRNLGGQVRIEGKCAGNLDQRRRVDAIAEVESVGKPRTCARVVRLNCAR